jgi:hypothetical protein
MNFRPRFEHPILADGNYRIFGVFGPAAAAPARVSRAARANGGRRTRDRDDGVII